MDQATNDEYLDASNEEVVNEKEEENPLKRKRTEEGRTPGTNNGATRVSEDNVALFRTYRKLNVKLVRSRQHHDYLLKCTDRDFVPKTLRSTIQPQVPDTTPKFLKQWEQEQLDHGRRLVKLLATYWDERCKHINGQINELKQELVDSTDDEEMEHINRLIESTKISVEKEIRSKPQQQQNKNQR